MKNKMTTCLLVALMSAAPVMADVNPEKIDFKVRPVYGYRTDGMPGRIVTVRLEGGELKGDFTIAVSAKGKNEKNSFHINAIGSTEVEVMLPAGVGTDKKTYVNFVVQGTDTKLKQKVEVPAMRHWNIYLYNHAHVDIGYTNTHKNVERLHKTNIIEGIKLANETKDFVDGAAYVWNPEVTWPMERLWNSNPEMRPELVEAMKKGQICLDASYLNLNTSTCADEEMFHIFRFSRQMQKLSGQPADVFQQFDIPGISWGLIPVMAQEGVKYVISWPNSDRGGHAHSNRIDGYPFWWVGPDGESKVLFFQPGRYANSGSMGGKGASTGRPWFGQRDPEKVPPFIKTGKANVNFTGQLEALEKEGYPYDFKVLSWSLWDNNPIDADVPYAVKEWNEKYAYPKIRICGGHEIMSMIEEKYGDRLPVVSGDYTEYWTDGVGTAAKLTAKNRNVRERLIQAETLWTELGNGRKQMRDEFDEAWRYVMLGSEHTYCYENPKDPYFQDAIWKVKQSYFHEAEDRSFDLVDESLAPVTDKADGALGDPAGPAKGGIAVFNTHSWAHSGILTLSAKESQQGDKVVDEKGNEVLSQRLSTGELAFYAADVPAHGSRHFRVVKGKCSLKGGCTIEGTTLKNGSLTVKVDAKTGNIAALTREGDTYNYIGEAANTFAWLPANVDEPKADTVKTVTVTEQGPLVVELCVKSNATGVRGVSRTVRLSAGMPYVEISNVVDKLPLEEKDGIHFGFAFNLPRSITRFDIPWGVMEIEKDQWPQGNRNWIAMQRWLDMSNDTHGITWCSLDAPLFEYGTRSANIAMGWGARGNWLKKLEPSSTIYSWAMNNHWHTNFPLTQEGPVQFRYRLYPHREYNVVESNRFGVEQAQPLAYVTADKNPDLKPMVAISNDKVYTTILKSVGNGGSVILRLRSVSDQPETARLSFPGKQPKSVSICRNEETASEPCNGTVQMKPYGQLTLRLEY